MGRWAGLQGDYRSNGGSCSWKVLWRSFARRHDRREAERGNGMKAVIQRVSRATVEVDGAVIARIGQGLLVLLGIAKEDQEADAEHLVDKLIGMRVFSDMDGKMNRAIGDVGGQLLVVSQFTLLGDLRHGRRPGFDGAASPDRARILYERVVELIRERGVPIETGRFAATMRVSLDNEGPVTFLLDSQAEVTNTQVQRR